MLVHTDMFVPPAAHATPAHARQSSVRIDQRLRHRGFPTQPASACVVVVRRCYLTSSSRQRKRKRSVTAASRVRMFERRVISLARLEVLDSSGHGDPRNLFPFLWMPVRFNLHRLHDIVSWPTSVTMSLAVCMAWNPPTITNTFASSSEV